MVRFLIWVCYMMLIGKFRVIIINMMIVGPETIFVDWSIMHGPL